MENRTMSYEMSQEERKELIMSAYKRGFNGGIAVALIVVAIILLAIWII